MDEEKFLEYYNKILQCNELLNYQISMSIYGCMFILLSGIELALGWLNFEMVWLYFGFSLVCLISAFIMYHKQCKIDKEIDELMDL